MEVKLISMKKVLVIVSVLFASIASKAQSNAIQNLWAFAKGIMYGKELRGPDGTPVQRNDTAYFLYMEIKGLQKPEITSISYRNKNFSPAVRIKNKLAALLPEFSASILQSQKRGRKTFMCVLC